MPLKKTKRLSRLWAKSFMEMDYGLTTIIPNANPPRENYYVLTRKELDIFVKNLKKGEFILSLGTRSI